ncbi:glucokinase [Pseudoxanthomonas sangjuensis]|nr:glucokinase [Pseudoxanthomonas sangjuensis]KAF1706240.1 glucokinase [Pseudoxanthomonas sangjuensis]
MVSPTAGDARVNGAPFLAADVGGTHVRLAIVRSAGPAAPVEVLAFRKYHCTDHPGLADFIAEFLGGHDGAKIDRGVIASAGYALDDGTVITSNLPWPLSIRETRERLGFADLRLVNDFEAVAHAAATLDSREATRVAGPERPAVRGPVLVLGPGTGLGAALWIPRGERGFVLPTEAGQSALAPGNELELALLALMLKRQPHVSIEHAAISGPGIRNLYNALCELRGARSALSAPSDITAAAQAGGDAIAREALETFCGILGSAVGDMAMNYGATGGIRLAGGFLPQIREFLLHSRFAERFLNKGPMRAALERIPVHLVEHGQLGVVGAANWYLDHAGSG